MQVFGRSISFLVFQDEANLYREFNGVKTKIITFRAHHDMNFMNTKGCPGSIPTSGNISFKNVVAISHV